MKNELFISLLPLKTLRLTIKKTSIKDVDLIIKTDKQDETQMFLGGIKEKTKEERIMFLKKKEERFNNGIASSLTVYLDNTPIGFIGLKIDEENNNAEISYLFDKDYTGFGYCFESCSKLVEIGFKKLKLNKIYADTIEGNEKSKRVLERLGFKHEGTRRKQAYINVLKEYRDFYDYGLLESEYNNEI